MEDFDIERLRTLIHERRDLAERTRLTNRRRARTGIVMLVAVVVLAGVAGLVHQRIKGSSHADPVIQIVANHADPNAISIGIDESLSWVAQLDERTASDTSEISDGESPEDLAAPVAIMDSFVAEDQAYGLKDEPGRPEDLVTAATDTRSGALPKDAQAHGREEPIHESLRVQREWVQVDLDRRPSLGRMQESSAKMVEPTTRTIDRQSRRAPQGEGLYRVQLSAFRSEKAARDERRRLSRCYGNELMGVSLLVAKADLGEKGGLYRITTKELGSREAAENIHQNLREKGKDSLIVRQ